MSYSTHLKKSALPKLPSDLANSVSRSGLTNSTALLWVWPISGTGTFWKKVEDATRVLRLADEADPPGNTYGMTLKGHLQPHFVLAKQNISGTPCLQFAHSFGRGNGYSKDHHVIWML